MCIIRAPPLDVGGQLDVLKILNEARYERIVKGL